MDFIDSHAHLTDSVIYGDIENVLKRAEDADVKTIINICTDADTLKKGLQLSKKYSRVYNAAATTPHDVEKEGEEFFPLMAKHSRGGDLVAVGETGLDYYYKHSSEEMQKHFFRKYLHLALERNLPVIVHCRDACKDCLEILDAEYKVNNKLAPGVMHCFTGTIDEAEQIIERDWYLSLSGIVTFKKSETLCRVAKMIPLDRLLIETDAPYLAPQSRRGKTNEPSFLPETAKKIASLKNLSIEEVAKATTENTRKLFNLKNAVEYEKRSAK